MQQNSIYAFVQILLVNNNITALIKLLSSSKLYICIYFRNYSNLHIFLNFLEPAIMEHNIICLLSGGSTLSFLMRMAMKLNTNTIYESFIRVSLVGRALRCNIAQSMGLVRCGEGRRLLHIVRRLWSIIIS